MEFGIILTGVFIFFARMCDFTIGTMRIMMTVQGKPLIAFVLALFEITIWLFAVSTVLSQINEQPILIIFYSFGYATGNAVGILVERRLAFGIVALKLLTRSSSNEMVNFLRSKGLPVTTYVGEGIEGIINELYLVCNRRDLRWILLEVKKIDPKVFYIIEPARAMGHALKPLRSPMNAWTRQKERK
ncbi:MAG: DUF5698 domain-containing protein [Desulforegulaceae bacterium]|nr:DUF5698 domain-containing protein [Desulforegulaceae bacterium]